MAKKKTNASSGKRGLLFAALLVLVTFLLYFRITNHAFVNYDDDTLITSNRVVIDERASFADCFSWNIFTPHFKPLVLMSWRAEYQWFGENPSVFHFNNLLLHLFNVLLVFILSVKLLQKLIPDKKNQTDLAAFFIALTFAIHPLHVESVAWAVERKDVLYTFFFFLSWWAYIQYLEKSKYLFLLLSAFFYLMVVLTKSMGITLIAVVFLTDYLYGRKKYLALLKEKIPLLLCFVIGIYLYGLLNYFVGFFSGGVVGANSNIPEAIRATSESNPILQIGLMAFLKVFLLFIHTLVPLHISVIYEGAEIHKMLGAFLYVIPLLLFGMVYLAYRMRDKYKEVFFGLIFFLITVSPAIAIGKYGGVGVFAGDRYTYVPMLGLMFILVVLCFRIPSSFKQLPLALLLSLSAIYLWITIPAIDVWKNAETLWTNAIEKTVCAAPAYNGRGVYYQDVTKEPDKALEDFSQAIICDSTHSSALYNRGLILMNKKKNKEALKDLNRALQLKPTYVEAYVNRGNILRDMNENDAAMSDYNTAIQLSPNFSKSYFNRGSLFINLKRYDDAIQDNSKAISLDPGYAKAYYNRGVAYFYSAKKEEACQDFKVAMEQGYDLAAKTFKENCQ
jgi:tetratricopeptide (TPR) repeat protein